MRDLWKIRAAVGDTAQGFDLSEFDAAILSACDETDPSVESQPLWEYPNRFISKIKTLMTFEMDMFLRSDEMAEEGSGKAKVCRSQTDFQPWTSSSGENAAPFTGMGFWMDWIYDEETVISTGMSAEEPEVGAAVAWNRNFKQGVYIYDKKSQPDAVTAEVTFCPQNGDIHFHVKAE